MVIIICSFIAYVFNSFLSPACAQTFYPFKLGNHSVEGTNVEFSFPDETVNALYVFNFVGWNVLTGKTNQAVVRLYNNRKNLLDEGKSICINTNQGKNFGSIAFSKTDRANVGKVAYFTLTASPCTEGKNILRQKDHPELITLFEDTSAIAKILFQCLETSKSEQGCICTNKGEMERHIGRTYSFLLKHPELKGKEVSLFESEAYSPKEGKQTVSVSMPLEEIPRPHGLLKKCK